MSPHTVIIKALKYRVLKCYRNKSYICITKWMFINISQIYVHVILVLICVVCSVVYSAAPYADALGRNPVSLIFHQVLQWKYLTVVFICFIVLFSFLPPLIYKHAKIKAESQVLATYDHVHGHTTDCIPTIKHLLSSSSRAIYLGRAEIFRK